MKKQTVLATAFVASFAFSVGTVMAAPLTNTDVTLAATIAAKAQLTIPAVGVSFDDSALGDPDAVPSIPGSAPAVVSAKLRTAGSAASLTVTAASDFSDGGTNTIPISNVSSGANGDLQAVANMPTTPATATLFSGKPSGAYAGTMAFNLANSWNYVPASYTPVTLTYTLTAP